MTHIPSLPAIRRRARHLASRRNRPGHPDPAALWTGVPYLLLVIAGVWLVAAIT